MKEEETHVSLAEHLRCSNGNLRNFSHGMEENGKLMEEASLKISAEFHWLDSMVEGYKYPT